MGDSLDKVTIKGFKSIRGAIVEGPTEKIFIKDVVAPFLAKKNIFLKP